MNKRKKPNKQAFLPAIRVEDEAWEQAGRIKGLYTMIGERTTIKEIVGGLIMTHGPTLEKELMERYTKLKKAAAKK